MIVHYLFQIQNSIIDIAAACSLFDPSTKTTLSLVFPCCFNAVFLPITSGISVHLLPYVAESFCNTVAFSDI